MIRSWLVASVFAIGCALGCGGKQQPAPPPPPPPGDGSGSGSAAVDPAKPPSDPGKDSNVELKALADASCACKDVACSRGAVENFITWVNTHKDARGDEAQAEADTRRLLECAKKVGLTQDELATMLKKLEI